MKKTAFIILMSLCLLISLGGICFAQPTDISGHWSENQVLNWVNKGYINGYTDGSFKPDNPVSRAEFITFANKAFNFTATANPDFSDINSQSWYAGEVSKSVAAGYISGYQDGTFRPNKQITRLEAASIIARAIGSELPGGTDALNGFRDKDEIPAWGREAAGAVAAQGIIKGYTDQTFRFGQPITRAEAVVALDRALAFSTKSTEQSSEMIIDKAGTYGPASGEQSIEGNLTISASGVILQNTNITGNLLLTEGIGDGTVTLKNVTVDKSITIKGGGSNSINTENCTLPEVIVNKPGVNITAKGGTLTNVTLESGATVHEIGNNGPGFENVSISSKATAQTQFSFSGTFKEITVAAKQAKVSIFGDNVADLYVIENATGAEIEIAEDVTVKFLNIFTGVTIFGKGKIETARVMTAGSTINIKPNKLENPNNVDVTIDGESTTDSWSGSQSSGDGTGGGDGNAPLNLVGAYLVDTGDSIRNSNEVPVRPEIKLVFDRGVVRDYWDNNKSCITMESTSGNEVPLNVSRISNNDSEKRHIYVRASNDLTHGESYNLIISSNLMANNGNTLGREVVTNFRVETSGSGSGSGGDGTGGGDGNASLNLAGAYLVDTGDSIRNSDEVPVRPEIKLVFDRGVVRDYWDNNKSCITMESTSGNEVTLNVSRISNNDSEKEHIYVAPQNDLTHGESYNLIISSNLMANNGKTLGHEVVINFRVKTSGSGSGGGGNDDGEDNTPAAPILTDAQVTTQGDVSLTFSEDMADPNGKYSGFAVTVNGTPVTIDTATAVTDTKKIKLVLATKVTSGDQVVQVAYAKPEDAALQVTAADGGVLESFAPQSVTNSLPGSSPVFVSADVTTQGDVSITFNKDIADPDGKHAGFTVTVDGAPATINAATAVTNTKKIKLVPATKVTSGDQVVQVAYTKPGDAALQVTAADGGVLESFAPQDVNNSLAVPTPAPVLTNVEVTNKGDISMQFDNEMDVPAADDALMGQICDQFTVTVNGVENIVTAVSSTNTIGKVKLVLTNKVTAGQSVTLAYSKSDNTDVQLKSVGGGVLASYAAIPVANN